MGLRVGAWLSAFVGVALLTAGCESIVGKTVLVEFDKPPRLAGGENALLEGVAIGRVGKPQVANGVVRVPIHLERDQSDALARGAVFVVRDDPSALGKACLFGVALEAENKPDPSKPATYRGADSELELTALVGGDRARALWEKLTK